MNMEQFTEYVGYVASAMVLISFLMKNMRTLRILNTVGCLFFVVYGSILLSAPIIITNVGIVLVNGYYLMRKQS